MNEEEIYKFLESLTPKVGDQNYVGPVGGGLYQIGPGCYTGEKGYEEFTNELMKELDDKSKK